MNTATVPAMALDPKMRRKLEHEADRARAHTIARNALIVAAVAAGASLREVGEAVKLTHVAIKKIVDKERAK